MIFLLLLALIHTGTVVVPVSTLNAIGVIEVTEGVGLYKYGEWSSAVKEADYQAKLHRKESKSK